MRFQQFISSLHKISLSTGNRKYILGNSSADYDSIFGSIIYAFFLTYQLGQTYLPLIDCKRNQIPLRFDISYIMDKYNINHKQLLFTEDIDMNNKENLFYLYDHNYREGFNIIEIIDHHALKQYENMPNKQNRIIYPSGSALTLLFYMMHSKYLSQQEQIFQQAFRPYITIHNFKDIQTDQLIWKIIRNGVLIDSFGFDQKQKQRWTHADQFLVQTIQKQINFDYTYDDLMGLKFNQKMNLNLNLQEHLVRDYKMYHYQQLGKVQYSIVCLNPDVFIQKYSKQLLEKFNNKQSKYQTYMIMFIWIKQQQLQLNKQPQFGRQALFIVNQTVQKEKRQQIYNKIQLILNDIKMIKKTSFNQWRRWNDPSVTVSRKKIDQVFRENLSKIIKINNNQIPKQKL